MKHLAATICLMLGACLAPSTMLRAKQVSYSHDIRMILSDHCYQCHGPDGKARKADLRLDQEQGTIIEMGGLAISRRDPSKSEFLHRIHSTDPEQQMPPAEVNKPLSDAQRDLLNQWVMEGAPWSEHWAYTPLKTPPIPSWRSGNLPPHPVDRFIQSRLHEKSITPSPKAHPVSLLRRLHLDLTGLVPLAEDAERFLANPSRENYTREVEALLASPRYVERMAAYWFDLVRFGSTTGVHADNTWHVNPYRNWVIEAFNQNMPFDHFTREQLAGDLLPGATRKQRIAATYNRLNLSTREGGSQAKEFLAKYMADRVRNAGSVWLATTLGCAECHDHKFDPLSMKDFYSMGAFFADIDQVGVYGADFPPYLPLPSATQRAERTRLERELKTLKTLLDTQTPTLESAMQKWESQISDLVQNSPTLSEWHALGPFKAKDFKTAFETDFGPETHLNLEQAYGEEGLRWEPHPEWTDGKVHPLQGDNAATYLFRNLTSKMDREWTLWFGSDDGISAWLNGERILHQQVTRGVAPDQETISVQLKQGENQLLMKISNGGGGYGFFFRSSHASVPEEILTLLKKPIEERNAETQNSIKQHFRSVTPLLKEARDKHAVLVKSSSQLQDDVVKVLATVAVPPPITRILPRGNWMDESGAIVTPNVPSAMGGTFRKKQVTGTRLDLANWLVDPSNPLTARVFMNRLWMLLFGQGLSHSMDDFGAQGISPSHPDLLDWLAVEWMASGWDIKHMVRLIVLSDTYRQSSRPRPTLISTDPFNRLVARQNRQRMDAEMIRDMALHTSGLLNRQVGGDASARPYQPPGYYRHLNFPKRSYEHDQHAGQFRRAVYMHWQRQYLHPALKVFDAPSREECVAKRPRSNTPLAALVMMNDPSVLEAARFLAERALTEGPKENAARVDWCFRQVLSRSPVEAELRVILKLQEQQQTLFESNPDGIKDFLEIGITPRHPHLASMEVATWTMVTRAIMNLHEAILRP